MKRKTLSFVVMMLFVSLLTFSQTQKGRWIVSGNSTFQVSNTKPENGDGKTMVILSPSIGYFVIDGLAVGVDLNLLTSDGSTAFSILPSASYYFDTKSQVKPFAQMGLGYSSLSTNNNTYGGLAVGAGAGVLYQLNDNVGVNLGLQYLRSDYDSAITNTIGGLMGFSIFF